jgi:hypothetical protein
MAFYENLHKKYFNKAKNDFSEKKNKPEEVPDKIPLSDEKKINF